MSYSKSRTRFTGLIRIDPVTLAWIKENKDTKTCAGYLDKIINKHIRHERNSKA